SPIAPPVTSPPALPLTLLAPPAVGPPSAGCAVAGAAPAVPGRGKTPSVRHWCHCGNELSAVDLGRIGRAQLIVPVIGGMVIVTIRAKMLARQRFALVQQEADLGTGAEHAERRFDFRL